VIGYGSIGARHARILTELGCATAVATKQTIDFPTLFETIPEALSRHAPDYVVIANATSRHLESVKALAHSGFDGIVLVEKPVFDRLESAPNASFDQLYVAYNLRFHPIIQRMKAILSTERILSVSCYAGQYLPNWRPGTDYRQSYSSQANLGGGVLRDLSHELDYLGHILGNWLRVCAIGGHLSSLDGDSDDLFGLIAEFERCPLVMVHLNYTDRVGRRRIIVNTDQMTLEVDLVSGQLYVNDAVEKFEIERDHSYRVMHVAAQTGVDEVICTLPQALATLALIEATEQSAKLSRWITNQ
jgi:predicted dehydrogenase